MARLRKLKPVETKLNALDMFLARASPQLVGLERSSTIGTVLLMLEGADRFVRWTAIERADAQEFPVDSDLVRRVYTACPRHLRARFADSAVVTRCDPETFKFIFRDAFRQKLSVEERMRLASSLRFFLQQNHGEAPKYRKTILAIARAPERRLAMVGLGLLGCVEDLSLSELELLRRGLASRSADHRMSALGAATHLLRHHELLHPETLAWCLSDELVAAVRRICVQDPDRFARWNARNLLRVYSALPPSIRPSRRRRSTRR